MPTLHLRTPLARNKFWLTTKASSGPAAREKRQLAHHIARRHVRCQPRPARAVPTPSDVCQSLRHASREAPPPGVGQPTSGGVLGGADRGDRYFPADRRVFSPIRREL